MSARSRTGTATGSIVLKGPRPSQSSPSIGESHSPHPPQGENLHVTQPPDRSTALKLLAGIFIAKRRVVLTGEGVSKQFPVNVHLALHFALTELLPLDFLQWSVKKRTRSSLASQSPGLHSKVLFSAGGQAHCLAEQFFLHTDQGLHTLRTRMSSQFPSPYSEGIFIVQR